MKIFLKKKGFTLVPAGQSDLDTLKKIDNDKIVECDMRQSRNVEFHRLFFAMLRVAFDNWWGRPAYKSTDELLIALKYEIGHVHRSFLFNGKIMTEAKSISFKNMDNIEFKEFFDRCSNCLSKHLGIHVLDLLKESEERK